MRDFQYYSKVNCPYPESFAFFLKEEIDKFDEVAMTKAERIDIETFARQKAKERRKIEQEKYSQAEGELTEQFWKDCREDLGYDEILTLRGCRILEAKAWEDGHSCGYSDVYNCLCDLEDFVRNIVKEKR